MILATLLVRLTFARPVTRLERRQVSLAPAATGYEQSDREWQQRQRESPPQEHDAANYPSMKRATSVAAERVLRLWYGPDLLHE
jgi:hypothetical protein